MIEGYETIYDDRSCVVVGAPIVSEELEKYRKKRGEKDVRKVGLILERLARDGPQALSNKEQFRNEGSFSSGKPDGKKHTVYAVKAFQLRVYGSFVTRDGRTVFVCVECAVKKKDKADANQLQRVASSIGDLT